MNIVAFCFNTETNTFSPQLTELTDFEIVRREEFQCNPSLSEGLGIVDTWKKLGQQYGHNVVLGLCAYAQPSGRLKQSTYLTLLGHILSDIRAVDDIDIVLLDLHGAMAAEGLDDCEGDILQHVRALVGPDVIIGVELDPHCHLSEAMREYADLIICYKEYPHTDVNERAKEVYRLSVKAKDRFVKPCMVVFDCQMLGMYPTTSRTMRMFVDLMKRIEREPGILSVSLIHGFPWGDTVDTGSQVLVISNNTPSLAEHFAKVLGLRFFSLRKLTQFHSVNINLALSSALASEQTPVVVADQSDNPGGGAPGDSTYALQWLLDNNAAKCAIAFLYDPESVAQALNAGVGAEVHLQLGGKSGQFSGSPVAGSFDVIAINRDAQHAFPQSNGEVVMMPIGDTAVVRIRGIDIVLTNLRSQCFSPACLGDFELDPSDYQLIVVKSTQHFYTAFSTISHNLIYMSAPGAIPPDMTLIPFQKMSKESKYPWKLDPFAAPGSKQKPATIDITG